LSKVAGTGGATVVATVKPYGGKYPRSATVTIGTRPFIVTQEGTCAPALRPTSLSLGADGAKKTVRVGVPDGCRWSASSDRTWLTVSPASGTDTGSVKVVVRPNTQPRSRRGTVVVGGRTVEVVQAGTSAAAPAAGAEAAAAESADHEADGVFAYYLAAEATGASALDEDATGTVLSLANPSERAVTASLSFAQDGSPPVEHSVTIPARAQVSLEPFDVPGLAAAHVAVAVAADGPVAVDRTTRGSSGAARATASTAAPARPAWHLAEAAAGAGRELSLRIGNPNAEGAEVTVRVQRPSGRTAVRHYRVAPLGRSTIRLADEERHTVTVESAAGQPVSVEGVPRWRDAPRQGQRAGAWSSPALATPAADWLVAGAETGGQHDASSWLRVGNASAQTAVLDLTLIPEGGAGEAATRTVEVEGSGSARLDLGTLFPEAVGQRFGVLVQAHDPAARLVIERETRWSGGGAAGPAVVRAPGLRLAPD
jgi:hypothetical protein